MVNPDEHELQGEVSSFVEEEFLASLLGVRKVIIDKANEYMNSHR